MHRLAFVIAALSTLTGCVLEPVDFGNRRCPCIAGWTCDTARDVCVPLADAAAGEVCNAIDDDGDSRVDEGSGLCASADHATGACTAGTCVLTCGPGFADCDDDPDNGCEASLGDPESCGSCTNRCDASKPLCAEAGGAFACVEECRAGMVLCGASCVDTESSPSHCGGCDRPCELGEGVSTSCSGGACAYACLPGRANCDPDAMTCERDVTTLSSCGGCDIACSTVHATPECRAGACAITSCESGWYDCDRDPATGCESDLRSVAHCGACGVPCTFANASASCDTGTCTMGKCAPGYADCDGMDSNGCETDLRSTSSCGACGVVCGGGETCESVGCAAPDDVVEIAAGSDFSCALLNDGRVYCWGADASGQLGNGSGGASSTAVAVSTIDDATDLDTGPQHACAVREEGLVACWGENGSRQLGNAGPPLDQSSPVTVRDLTDAVQVAAGASHTCARRRGGSVSCWGDNAEGQLGTGGTGSATATPQPVVDLPDAIDLDAGRDHTCAIRATGAVVCWGNNAQGQLGDGTTTRRSRPVTVASVVGARAIAAGDLFTCALTDEGAWCWGDNASGQLGDGTTDDRPTAVASMLVGATRISAGAQHTCALASDGSLACWGLNDAGQLGDGTMQSRATPAASELTTGVALSAGASHTCAALGDGSAACWGSGADGRLGNGATADSSSPVAVLGLP